MAFTHSSDKAKTMGNLVTESRRILQRMAGPPGGKLRSTEATINLPKKGKKRRFTMFRKKLVALVAAALMTLTASSAFAAFADLELIRVYYDRAGAEIATDLGNVKTLLAAPSTTIGGSFGSLTTGYAVYFALDRTNNNLWVSGSTTAASVINGGSTGLTGLKSGTTPMYTQFKTQGGTNYTGLASVTSSYKNKISSTQGTMAGAITAATGSRTEASLASLISTGTGSVSQALYFWANGNTTVVGDKTGTLAATIVTNANGSTTITAATTPTPIPAAFYLMGSGLLGLVGLRRRNKA
jgi:hypothetical protein